MGGHGGLPRRRPKLPGHGDVDALRARTRHCSNRGPPPTMGVGRLDEARRRRGHAQGRACVGPRRATKRPGADRAHGAAAHFFPGGADDAGLVAGQDLPAALERERLCLQDTAPTACRHSIGISGHRNLLQVLFSVHGVQGLKLAPRRALTLARRRNLRIRPRPSLFDWSHRGTADPEEREALRGT